MILVTPVLLESPYGNDDPAIVARNVRYADACQLDALRRGEAPQLGHLLYTRVLDDRDPEQRAMGIRAHLAWVRVVERMVLYVDYGVSTGMRLAIEAADADALPMEYRRFGAAWVRCFERGDVSGPGMGSRALDGDDVRRLFAS